MEESLTEAQQSFARTVLLPFFFVVISPRFMGDKTRAGGVDKTVLLPKSNHGNGLSAACDPDPNQ